MELQEPREEPLEYAYGDVTFLVKRRATAYDRFVVVTQKDAGAFAEACVRQMVAGWRGVTSKGKPVAYGYDLIKFLPPLEGRNIYLLLADFIQRETDLLGEREDPQRKNDSREPSGGSSPVGASSAQRREPA